MKPYFETENGKLYHGDCLEILPELEPVDLTVTSPPYDDLREYDGSQWGGHVWRPVIKEMYRLTKQGGVVVWVVGDATVNGSETGTSFRQALWAMECGFRLHDTMIYDKDGAGGCKGSVYAYWNGFEFMFVFVKGEIQTFNPIKDRINKHGGSIVQARSRKASGGMTKKRIVQVSIRGRRFNIWRIKQSQKQKHPAPFPLQLAKDHIISWSNEGEIILDPFFGSGTTGVACEELGRKWIGIEISEKYCEIAARRIEKETQQLRLFA